MLWMKFKSILNYFVIPVSVMLLTFPVDSVLSQYSISETNLDTRLGLPWGGPDNFPYSQTVSVIRPTTSRIVGKIVIDRDGYDQGPLSAIAKAPFSVGPGKAVVVSIWGAGARGCYVEVFTQLAPPINQLASLNVGRLQALGNFLVPNQLEVGIGNQETKITPDPDKRNIKVDFEKYVYTDLNNNKYNATWFWARRIFLINPRSGNLLTKAPFDNVRIIVTTAGNQRYVATIGKNTVRSWKNIYGSGASCKP
jgi:hypothetical protein